MTVAADCFEAVLEAAYGDDPLGLDPERRAADKGDDDCDDEDDGRRE